MGQDGYLLKNEWPTYVFDGALMLLVMIVFFIWYPSQLQTSVRESMIELTSDGATIGSFREHGPEVVRGNGVDNTGLRPVAT